jgi:hypothetical protein
MTTLIEAARQALEALQFGLHVGFDESSERQIQKGGKAFDQHNQAITALRQAIEQAEKVEPVAWLWKYKDGDEEATLLDPQYFSLNVLGISSTIPLYTSPPPRQPWVGLTDEEISSIAFKAGDEESAIHLAMNLLKEKNT